MGTDKCDCVPLFSPVDVMTMTIINELCSVPVACACQCHLAVPVPWTVWTESETGTTQSTGGTTRLLVGPIAYAVMPYLRHIHSQTKALIIVPLSGTCPYFKCTRLYIT